MIRRVYFDTSAVVKLLRKERFSDDVARWVHDEAVEPVAGLLVETELRRAAERYELHQEDATAVLAQFNLFEHASWEFRAAGLIPGSALRTLDALHLTAALRIEAEAVITYDERMVTAAAMMGLPAIQPGLG